MFRRPTTGVFLQFLRFAHERRTVFGVFCLSLASETLFLAIFEEKPQATACFLRFSLVACKRNVIFGVFCISLTSDERFSAFFVFPRGWEMQSAAFFGFPKFGKGDFRCFSVFPTLGKYFLPIFEALFRTFYQLRGTLRSNAYCYHTICRQLKPSILHLY